MVHVRKHFAKHKMPVLMAAGILLGFCVAACTYPPEIHVRADICKVPYLQYKRDHDECVKRAQAAWPLTESQLRKDPRVYRTILNIQRNMVIECLEEKGYRILKEGETGCW